MCPANFTPTAIRTRPGSVGAYEEQIIAILKEQEAGMATADVCRRHGISSATFYKWKSKYGGSGDSAKQRQWRAYAASLELENL